jgi:hypothetical protein
VRSPCITSGCVATIAASIHLLVEDRLGLATVTLLLSVVTPLALGEVGGFARLVLGDLVHGVLGALRALAESPSFLRNVDHLTRPQRQHDE